MARKAGFFRTMLKLMRKDLAFAGVGSSPYYFMVGGDQITWTSSEYTKWVVEFYRGVSVVSACTGKLMINFAKPPWTLFKPDSPEQEMIPKHDLLTLLKRPNPQQGGAAWRAEAMGHYIFGGNVFIHYIEAGEKTKLRELELLRPDLVTIKLVPKVREILHYSYRPRAGSKVIHYKPDEVLHIPRTSLMGLFEGTPLFSGASKHADAYAAAVAHNANMINSGLFAGGILHNQGQLTAQQLEQLRLQVSEMSGPGSAGKTIISSGSGEMKYTRLSVTPAEVDFLNSMQWHADAICMVLGVPPEVIGRQGKFENYKIALRAMWEDGILPILDLFTDELNNWLVPKFDDGESIELSYDTSDIRALQEDVKELWDRTLRAVELHSMSPNEFRAAVGMPPYIEQPGGAVADQLYGPATRQPLIGLYGGGTSPNEEEE